MSAHMQSNLFLCHKICHLNLSLPFTHSYTCTQTSTHPVGYESCRVQSHYTATQLFWVMWGRCDLWQCQLPGCACSMCVCVSTHKSGFLGNTDFNFSVWNATHFQIYFELFGAAEFRQSFATESWLDMNKWSTELQNMLKGTLGLFPFPAYIFKAQSSNLDGDIPISCVSTLTLMLVFQRTADDKWQLSTFPIWRKSPTALPPSQWNRFQYIKMWLRDLE